MTRKCRIWWPKQLASSEHSPHGFLFGWFLSCSPASIDIVVACTFHETSLSHSQSSLQQIIDEANGKMPVFLQDKSMFTLLGHSAPYCGSNDNILNVGMEESNWKKPFTLVTGSTTNRKENMVKENCGCSKLDGFVEQCLEDSVKSGHWIQLLYDSCRKHGKDIRWVPNLHHIHWSGRVWFQCDVHVIVYEIPKYGMHHFSLNLRNSSDKVISSQKKPQWVHELHKKQPLFELDTVILAINCTSAAEVVLQRHLGSNRPSARISLMLLAQHALAIFVASVSTLFYVILQLSRGFSNFGAKTWLYDISAAVFCTTLTNIQIYCRQILYWPIFLQANSFRLQSCVEYEEKAALQRNSMWSSLAVDLLLGNLIGLALLFHAESVCLLIFAFANAVTNELLRSGCVWLMGVPAGFKLNTELATVLGMISLNAVQIWSTLWVFIGFLFIYFIRGLAVLGILFGVTVPAGLIIDMVSLLTLHVSTLHQVLSLLYSWQIQALSSLWRLFRGRKWNPLRQRLDSYDYTVKQHIVGSLLFTTLLLLLPTTSAFYIFFSILNTAITLISMLIEVLICIIHVTPFFEIFLWLVRRRRFPSGIWFEIASFRRDLDFACPDNASSPPENLQQRKDGSKQRSSILVTILNSNFLSIGQIVLPHYGKVFSAVSAFVTASAYGALTGKRTAPTLRIIVPSTLPWLSIPGREYWFLCRNSVIACMPDRRY